MRTPYFSVAMLSLALIGCDERDKSDAKAPAQGPVDSLALAVRAVEVLMVQDPSNATNYAERARLYVRMDSMRLAINDLERAASLDSLNVGYRQDLGDLYFTTVQMEKSERSFDRILAVEPENVNALLKLAEIKLILLDYKASMDLVNRALRKTPNLAMGYFLKGFVHMEMGDTSLAVSSFRTAVEQDPEDYRSFMQLGLLSARQNDPLALDYFNTAIELRPRSMEALYAKAMFLQEAGRDSAALKTYAQIMEIDSNNAVAYYNSGFVRMEYLRDLPGAKQDFSKAIKLNTNYYQAWYNRGVAMEREGKLDSAAANYQMTLMIEPGFGDAALALDRLARKGVRIKMREKSGT